MPTDGTPAGGRADAAVVARAGALRPRLSQRTSAAAREVALLVSVFVAYEIGRHLVRAREATAFADAELLLSLQRNVPFLPRELTLQRLALESEALVRAANVFYVSVHFPATVAFLLFLWVRRPDAYRRARSLLVVTTAVALLLHITFPLAPPRLLPNRGFVDTMAVYGPTAYGDGTQAIANQYAAMPSLHVAWALVVGLVLLVVLQGPWRWLALAHPALTVVVVGVTATHSWADVLAAGVLVVLAGLVVGRPLRPVTPASAGPVLEV